MVSWIWQLAVVWYFDILQWTNVLSLHYHRIDLTDVLLYTNKLDHTNERLRNAKFIGKKKQDIWQTWTFLRILEKSRIWNIWTNKGLYIYMIVSVSHHGCCSCCSSITSHVRPSSTNLTLVYSALFMAIWQSFLAEYVEPSWGWPVATYRKNMRIIVKAYMKTFDRKAVLKLSFQSLECNATLC